MYPAFRSEKSAWGFSLLLILLLALPFLLFWIGLPPREEAYKSIPLRYGAPGREIESIYKDPQSPDVLFLGSSMVMQGVYTRPLEQALSEHLGRPARVSVLAMEWQGLDLQYSMLRDLLQHHQPGLIILNGPSPVGTPGSPHPEAYRWYRYGDFQGDFKGFSLVRRLEIYGQMVLGGPRDLLSRIRPNVLGADETTPEGFDKYLDIIGDAGYHGAPFVAENVTTTKAQQALLLPVNSPLISPAPEPLPPYSLHFLHAILALARQHHCTLVFLHVPTDEEYGDNTISEFAWYKYGAAGYQIIGLPAKDMFSGMSKEQFLHYFANNHPNRNGGELFTSSITPAMIEAYDETRAGTQSDIQAKSSSQR